MQANDPESDQNLLGSMLAGNEAAFSALYRRHQPSVYRFVLHMTGAAEVAEDVTQEVFLALIRNPGAYDSGRGALAAYLFGVARHAMAHAVRRHAAHVTFDEAPPLADTGIAEDALADLTRAENIELLRRAVLSLPDRYREALVLCDLEEMDYAQAAAVLDCAVGTVRSRLHRARAMLAAKLRGKAAAEARKRWNPARCTL
jgi:RNA polymerase sigma-70 factor, ECF subfamily